jgi:hypothetical protein
MEISVRCTPTKVLAKVDGRQSAVAPQECFWPLPACAMEIELNINGQNLRLDLPAGVTLLETLRDYAGLTGTRYGCGEGQCGACTVLIDSLHPLRRRHFASRFRPARGRSPSGRDCLTRR